VLEIVVKIQISEKLKMLEIVEKTMEVLEEIMQINDKMLINAKTRMETVARITVQNPNLTEALEGALQPVKKLAQQRPLVLRLPALKVVQKDVNKLK